jgi:hypothetical protein
MISIPSMHGDQVHHAMDLCGFEALLTIHVCQDGRESFRKHCFSKTQRSNHKDVMTSSSSDHQTPVEMLLSFPSWTLLRKLLSLLQKDEHDGLRPNLSQAPPGFCKAHYKI